jgi:hypothetical protein
MENLNIGYLTSGIFQNDDEIVIIIKEEIPNADITCRLTNKCDTAYIEYLIDKYELNILIIDSSIEKEIDDFINTPCIIAVTNVFTSNNPLDNFRKELADIKHMQKSEAKKLKKRGKRNG